ncbi:alpha/beta hydrolase [Saccharopolyspora sp. K220]|uniref:alpha/beta hydrolase n=1 Tax=Saccharopolyspora soli TaxID=2926618 RepID=UPI001F5A7083|nr:alpha/beta hydrolase [Saccharopolyspora soli]MCI2424094.1 alpha/beta hydrolase [Saccharopolyspora soli]
MTLTSPPPFDSELSAVLAGMAGAVPPAVTPEMVPALHEAFLAGLPSDEQLAGEGAFEIHERFVPGPQDAPDIALFIASPAGLVGQRPVVYHTHGGGMMIGNNRLGLGDPLEWALELGLIVVSVEYRLAPKHPFPAAMEDVYAGLLWTAEHAEEVGGDPHRIVLAGGSGGGGLAAALALVARDHKGPRPIGQILMGPMLDDRVDTVSAQQMAGIGVWDRTSNETAWTALLGEKRGSADVSPYAAPARAADLSGLPPALLDVGSVDTLRDETVTYATRIWQAGGQAELHVWPGGFHGFDFYAPQAVLSQDVRAARLHWLRRLLGE